MALFLEILDSSLSPLVTVVPQLENYLGVLMLDLMPQFIMIHQVL